MACPEHREPADEFESPTPIEDNTVNWTLKIALVAHPQATINVQCRSCCFICYVQESEE